MNPGPTHRAILAARNPKAALVTLAQAIDAINERLDELASQATWGDWGADEYTEDPLPDEPSEGPMEVEQTEDATTIMFRPVSEEKQARRRMFADQVLHLQQALSHIDPNEDWIEHYVTGGPLWIYTGNRELVMSYPENVRALMVQDVDEESPEQGHLMSIDVLKSPCEVPDVGAGERALGVGEITGKAR